MRGIVDVSALAGSCTASDVKPAACSARKNAGLIVAVGLCKRAEIGVVERDLDLFAGVLVPITDDCDVGTREESDRQDRDEDAPVNGQRASWT